MKISKNTVVVVIAAWALTLFGHLTGLLRAEGSSLAIAAAAVFTMVYTQRDRVREHAEQQRAEFARLRVQFEEHTASMQAIGVQVKDSVTDQMRGIREEVLGIYGAGMQHDHMATVRAHDTARWGRDDLDTGPQSIYKG
jgi:hypothetical protein